MIAQKTSLKYDIRLAFRNTSGNVNIDTFISGPCIMTRCNLIFLTPPTSVCQCEWFYQNVKRFSIFYKMFLILFKVKKYRRKCVRYLPLMYFCVIALFFCCCCAIAEVNAKCTDVSCMNGGICGNGTCVCADGWQGDECQFCGGKVRYMRKILPPNHSGPSKVAHTNHSICFCFTLILLIFFKKSSPILCVHHPSLTHFNNSPTTLCCRLTDDFGNIYDGAGNYSVGVKCSWLIDARTTDHEKHTKQPSIRLHLEEFATECGWDHLYVYDGDSVDSPLLAVFR